MKPKDIYVFLASFLILGDAFLATWAKLGLCSCFAVPPWACSTAVSAQHFGHFRFLFLSPTVSSFCHLSVPALPFSQRRRADDRASGAGRSSSGASPATSIQQGYAHRTLPSPSCCAKSNAQTPSLGNLYSDLAMYFIC